MFGVEVDVMGEDCSVMFEVAIGMDDGVGGCSCCTAAGSEEPAVDRDIMGVHTCTRVAAFAGDVAGIHVYTCNYKCATDIMT
jgi:hypothetical protein